MFVVILAIILISNAADSAKEKTVGTRGTCRGEKGGDGMKRLIAFTWVRVAVLHILYAGICRGRGGPRL